ncbi:MAG: chemotaxis protein CheA [Planctomycetia bacterium]|nr:chemotaxis protein CheA [Planctomycetia bacterium]
MADTSRRNQDLPADDMAEFVSVYIDETGEQCEQLVQLLLALESEPRDARRIAEAFRLIHSIKGSAAMLGLDRITGLAHHLESHFERLRSGSLLLDGPTIEAALRCIDYFRACNDRLRQGEKLEPVDDLLEVVKKLGQATPPVLPTAPPTSAALPTAQTTSVVPSAPPTPPALPKAPPTSAVQAVPTVTPAPPVPPPTPAVPAANERIRRIRIQFTPGLPMADLKAELVLARLAGLGVVVESTPASAEFATTSDLRTLDIVLRTAATGSAITIAADVDGVVGVELDVAPPAEPAAAPAPTESGAVAETMRVGVERLDVLLNLVGELVVSRARFVQLVADMAPLFRKAAVGGRSGGTTHSLREAVESIIRSASGPVDRAAAACESQLEKLEEQGRLWEEGHRRYAELVESVDHLTRVADSLQRGVLSTRMVPVGPLLNRFKRSVRDIANELGKSVTLELAGEKTELDKRMIDELGDPLVHLVRNAIDHGIEPADVRLRRGKPEMATVRLAASHRGNSVIISISDDGGGIDVERIRDRAVARGLVSADQAATLSPRELIDFIWQPGFSTAAQVSNISGRGVGMDIVRTRIEALSGSIEIDSTLGVGSTFIIRLPLTLAIARCMLFRLEQAAVAVPVENVRELVTVTDDCILSIGGRRVCDIRGEFLPLVEMDEVFAWPSTAGEPAPRGAVLVIHSGSRAVAVGVSTLLGTQDLVVKSLDENFMRIRGIGGASILGDGEVCLLLDASAVVDIVMRSRSATEVHA